MGVTENKQILNTVFPAISMAASIATVVYAMLIQKASDQSTYWHLVVAMAGSSIFAAVGDMLQWGDHVRGICLTESLMIQFFDWAVVAWIGCIAHYMWSMICVPGRTNESRKRCRIHAYHLVVWGSSLILMMLPFADGYYEGWPRVYGHGGDWCWLASANATSSWEQPQAATYWKFIIWRVPFLVLEIYVACVIVRCRFNLFKAVEFSEQSASTGAAGTVAKRSLYRQLAGYPIIMLVTWAFGTVRAFYNDFNPDNLLPVWTVYIHMTLASLSGLWNFLFFVISKPKPPKRDQAAVVRETSSCSPQLNRCASTSSMSVPAPPDSAQGPMASVQLQRHGSSAPSRFCPSMALTSASASTETPTTETLPAEAEAV
mmetsp:Transcript_49887/g.129941  ORF Transcript_49887/g.129941 Transcript_49887/m.129941 type:complete len:373 (+) Transcript_49887:123-1241(+)